jgi:hypothetical protein
VDTTVRAWKHHGAVFEVGLADKVRGHQAANHIPQDRGGGAHDEHGADE